MWDARSFNIVEINLVHDFLDFLEIENRFFRFFSSYVQKKILLSSYRSRKIQRIEITGESYRVLAYCCLNYTIFDIRLVIGGDRNNKRIIRKIITRLNWEIKKYVGFSLGRL